MKRSPWKRLATLRAARRRGTELPPRPAEAAAEPTPPLEPPDEDREFLPADERRPTARAAAPWRAARPATTQSG